MSLHKARLSSQLPAGPTAGRRLPDPSPLPAPAFVQLEQAAPARLNLNAHPAQQCSRQQAKASRSSSRSGYSWTRSPALHQRCAQLHEQPQHLPTGTALSRNRARKSPSPHPPLPAPSCATSISSSNPGQLLCKGMGVCERRAWPSLSSHRGPPLADPAPALSPAHPRG